MLRFTEEQPKWSLWDLSMLVQLIAWLVGLSYRGVRSDPRCVG